MTTVYYTASTLDRFIIDAGEDLVSRDVDAADVFGYWPSPNTLAEL